MGFAWLKCLSSGVLAIQKRIFAKHQYANFLVLRKNTLGAQVLSYMKDNDLANFVLDGPGGTIARSERVSRPALKRSTLRQQLFLQFADQPERVAEALRAIEGIPEGGDDMSVGGTKRDILSRRLPRSQNISLN